MKIPSKLPILHHHTFQTLDSTKLTAFMSCERKFFYQYVLGMKNDYPSHNLVFGAAFHLAMEHLYTHGYSEQSIQDAYQAFLDEYRKDFHEDTDFDYGAKNPSNVFLALHEYVERYARDSFKVIALEQAGDIELGSGRAITYKFDSIVEQDDEYYTLEHKTGSIEFNWWKAHWKTRLQTGTYFKALQDMYGEKSAGFVIDGVLFQKKENKYIRVQVRMTPVVMENWLFQVNHLIDMLEMEFERLSVCNDYDSIMSAFPKRTSNCVNYGRMCEFETICFSNINPIRFQSMAPAGFKVGEFWNPKADHHKKE